MSNGNGKSNGSRKTGPTGAPPKWLTRAPDLIEERYVCREYFCDIDAEMKLRAPEDTIAIDDLFRPAFWSKNVNIFREGDRIRCVSEHSGYDIVLIAEAILSGGVVVSLQGEKTRPGSLIGNRLIAAQKAARAAEHAQALALATPPGQAS